MKKQLVECKSLGLPLTETQARTVDSLVKSLPKECHYRKSAMVPSSVELVKGERADISLVSTENLDRDNEIILSKGMLLDVFQQNPIVTWCHKYDQLPVGKAQWIKRVDNGIKAKTQYADKPDTWEGDWFADAVWSMTQQGIIKGKSVGFLPTKIRSATKEEITSNPTWEKASAVIETATLIEFAACPLPVNQDSLVQAVAKGLTDEATLKRLGFNLPQIVKKPIQKKSIAYEFSKALERIAIDPQKIIEQLKEKYKV